MALPWVRLDSNIAGHDKILNLLSDPSTKKWQAATSYQFSIAWSGGHGTDGHIPTAALPFIHGTTATARLLEKYGLWTAEPTGWFMPNFAERQELDAITEGKRRAQRVGGAKGNCIRYHGKDCGCWRNGLEATP